MQKVWCPNRDADEWDGEQCQENLYIISKGPDENYFELEDVSADPKFAEVIDTIRYPLFPYGIRIDKLIPGVVLEPGDIVHENIIHATIREQMARYSADSFLIYQNGQLIYEKYTNAGDLAFPDSSTGGQKKIRANDFTQSDRHALFSVTKSFIGMVFTKLLMEVNDFNDDDLVIDWVPGLADTSAFNTATARMIADMSVDFQYHETNPCDTSQWSEQINAYLMNETEGVFPLPKDCEHVGWMYLSRLARPAFPDELISNGTMTGQDLVDSLPQKLDYIKLMKKGNATEHGIKFEYRSILSDVVALICSGVIEKAYPGEYESVGDYFQREIWAKLGTDDDMVLNADANGSPYWWSLGSARARDVLRSGIMLLNDGTNHKGQQVLPKDAVADLFDGTDLSRSQISRATSSNTAYLLSLSGVLYNSTLFPDVKECGVMTTDWSYHGQMRSYNPGKQKGTGEILTFEGYLGQNVYIDRVAKLVVVQQSMNGNYLRPDQIQNTFYALSNYFRCNPPTDDSPDTTISQDTEGGDAGEEDGGISPEDSITSSTVGGVRLSICYYSGAFLSLIGFFFV